MSLNWQSLVLLHALFSACQALQFRAIARAKATRHAGLAINAIAFSALYICGLFLLPIIGEVNFDIFKINIHMFVAAAALFVMAIYFMYKAMTHLESATASVLGTSSALFVVILARFFFNEHLSSLQLFGIVLLIPCLWYVLLLASKGKKLLDFNDQSWLKGFSFMICSSFFLAFAHILEKEILETASLGTYVAFGWLLQVTFAWILYFLFGRKAKNIFRSNKIIRRAIQLGLFRAGAGLFFVMALIRSDNVSLVTVIANFRIILVAVLAGWVLNEKQYYYKKLAAAALSVIALSIIFWN